MDLEKLMAQAQEMQAKMQEQMLKDKEAKKTAEYTGESGAGLVTVMLNGSYGVKKISLDDSLLKEDKDLIEDLIAAAVNDAVKKVEEDQKVDLSNLGDGFKMPEGFKFPF